MVVTVTLENGEVLTFKEVKRTDVTLTFLDNEYTLTGGYKLYKEKGHVICGEEVPYKSLDIHIEN